MVRAVTLPTPGSSSQRAVAGPALQVVRRGLCDRPAARRKARTRYVGSRARSSRYAMRLSASTGSMPHFYTSRPYRSSTAGITPAAYAAKRGKSLGSPRDR